MKKALIIGVTGNFGRQMAESMLHYGWSVKALMRDPKKAPEWLSQADIIQGNATNLSDVSAAAQGCDIIVYAANPAYYRWHQEALKMLEPTAMVAEKRGLRILLPGNVYSFAPNQTLIDEQLLQVPPTDKGEVRLAMEARLKQASERGAKVTIVRAGDFLGPNMHFSWLELMLKHKTSGWQISMPHDEQHVHFWSFLPDLCQNAISLLEQATEPFEIYHDEGLKLATSDWKQAFADNDQTLKIKRLPWYLFDTLAIINPTLREVRKMRYLWQKPVLLDGTKMKRALALQFRETAFANVIRTFVEKDIAASPVNTQVRQGI